MNYIPDNNPHIASPPSKPFAYILSLFASPPARLSLHIQETLNPYCFFLDSSLHLLLLV